MPRDSSIRSYGDSRTGDGMAAAGKFVTLEHHWLALQRPRWVPFDKAENSAMQWAGSVISKHRDSPAIHCMTPNELAFCDFSTAAGGIT